MRAKRLSARAMERQRRGIHEHQRQVAEQVAAASEQTLLDVVLHTARHQTALAGRLQFLAQPRHRPIEMVQPQALDPGDGVVVHPFLARPVRARHEQPVQHAHEHRPLDREAEPAAVHKLLHRIAEAQPVPQTPEQQRTADPNAGKSAVHHVVQHRGPIRVARQRGDQAVQFPARLQGVLATERADRALAHPLALAHALDEVEIAVPPGGRFAHEHDTVVCGNIINIQQTKSKP